MRSERLMFIIVAAIGLGVLIHSVLRKDETEVQVDPANVEQVGKWLGSSPETALAVERAIVAYELEDWRKKLIGMIKVESQGRHFDGKGNVLTSKSGAKGIAQIKPSTAFQYLRYEMTPEDRAFLTRLGAEDPLWIVDMDLIKVDGVMRVKKSDLKKVTAWISEEHNNIAMWGYIVKHLRGIYGDFNRTTIAYNLGRKGMRVYLAENRPQDHFYVRRIAVMEKEF